MREVPYQVITESGAVWREALFVYDRYEEGSYCDLPNHHYRVAIGQPYPQPLTGTVGMIGPASAFPRTCDISFQEGPVAEKGANGVSHEALLAILIDRLEHFQSGAYACEENATALEHIRQALAALQARTRARLARGVEGTSVV